MIPKEDTYGEAASDTRLWSGKWAWGRVCLRKLAGQKGRPRRSEGRVGVEKGRTLRSDIHQTAVMKKGRKGISRRGESSRIQILGGNNLSE